ncbi:uncharacterized protein LOC120676326 isoform X3 [Panicum virgatum]|uniref:uncharacterized protein LOC120676326 isoform X3 n=1 Tax=Panicum virgatum TaxID=38727 RepID=UPI0019D524CF|nr:uncharacterized protein LOC120676326 isoform X3 [Panicum virgatum]
MQPAAADDKIYLVMGGSEIHYYISLGWALQNVPLHKTVVLVYIFRPAFDIPMLSRVVQPTDDFLISAYRRGRREHILRSSELHVRICARKKVRAEKLIVENDDVAAALLDLIVQHQNIPFGGKNTRKVGKTSKSIMQHFLSTQWKSHFYQAGACQCVCGWKWNI